MGTTELEEMIVSYKADLSNLTSGVQKVKEQIASVPKAAEESSRGFLGSFSKMGGGLLQFGSQLGMTVFGVKNLATTAMGLFSSLIAPNASMEQTRVAFTNLLGSSKKAGDYLKELWAFAAKTPFNFPELANDAQQMMAFGFAAKDVVPMLTDIGDAMSAMGKGQDAVAQVVMVFGQMHAAGKLNAQDMMQLTSTGIPAWRILAESMHLSVAEVQKMTTQGLIPADDAIARLRKGMHETFGGAMAAQATTFNGLLSTLEDNARAALMSFTGPIFDLAKQGLTQLGNIVTSPDFQNWAKNLGQQIGTLFTKIPWKDIGGFIAEAANWIGTLATGAKNLATPLAGIVGDFLSWAAKNDLMGKLGLAVGAIFTGISNIMTVAGGFLDWLRKGGTPAEILKDAMAGIAGAFVVMETGGLVGKAGKSLAGLIPVLASLDFEALILTGGLAGIIAGIVWLATHPDQAQKIAFNWVNQMHAMWISTWNVQQQIESLKRTIQDLLNMVSGSVNVGSWHIPMPFPGARFAMGGTTPGGPILVGERGPEILSPPAGSTVSPLTGGASGFSGSSGSSRPLHIHFEVGSREIAYAILNDIGQLQAQHVRLKTGIRR